MSLEQIEELAEMARTEGHGKQGRSRSRAENVTALRHLAQYEQLGLSHDAAVKATAQAELASPTTIRAAHKQFTNIGTLPTPSTAHRGSGNPIHPLHISNSRLTFDGELLLHQLLQDVREKNTQETITTLRAGLAQYGINVSRTTVFRRSLTDTPTNVSSVLPH